MSATASAPAAHATSVRFTFERDGELARVVLGGTPGNTLDLPAVIALHEGLSGLRRHHRVKLVVFQGEGADFGAGAPLEEYLPENVGRFLPAFHHLVREMDDVGIPTAALVRGRCLGASFELASACGRILCDGTARFAATGVAAGTIPALATITLPWRVGGARATDLVLTGRTLNAAEAVAIGLADQQAQDIDAAFNQYFEEHLAPKSALVVRYAWRAARRSLATALDRELPRLTQLVLDDLMTHRDAMEGVRALLEERRPSWTHV